VSLWSPTDNGTMDAWVFEGVRVLTLGLDGSALKLKQVKGRFNRAANGYEMRVVQRWEGTIVESVRKYRRKGRVEAISE